MNSWMDFIGENGEVTDVEYRTPEGRYKVTATVFEPDGTIRAIERDATPEEAAQIDRDLTPEFYRPFCGYTWEDLKEENQRFRMALTKISSYFSHIDGVNEVLEIARTALKGK